MTRTAKPNQGSSQKNQNNYHKLSDNVFQPKTIENLSNFNPTIFQLNLKLIANYNRVYLLLQPATTRHPNIIYYLSI